MRRKNQERDRQEGKNLCEREIDRETELELEAWKEKKCKNRLDSKMI